MESHEQPQWIAYFLGGAALCLLLVGVWSSYSTVTVLLRAQDQRSWVETRCQLQELRADGLGARRPGEAWSLALRYRYRVDGADYSGDQSGLQVERITPERYVQLRSLQRAFAQGAPVPCFYDPKRPSDAVLFRELSDETLWGGAVMALLGWILGVLLARAAWRLKGERNT